MSIKELIKKLDECLSESKETISYMYEMATPLGKVKDKVHNLSEQIIKHCLKIFLYGKEENKTLHHWAHELNNWLTQCMIKIKGTNRYPKATELVTWLTDWYSDETDIDYMRYALEHDYMYQGHTERKEITNEQLYQNYLHVLKELCPLIVLKQATDDKVQEILERYILA